MNKPIVTPSYRLAPLISEERAATLLGMKGQTLAKWRVEGVGPPFVKVGRSVRYKEADLVAFIEARTFKNTTEALNAIQ